MDIRRYNRKAWDRSAAEGGEFTQPVRSKLIRAARKGQWQVTLTRGKPVPKDWLPDVQGRDVLCLASGGGQQGPILAAAGARVTVFDNSPGQLEKDRFVAKRDGLHLSTVEGDMSDLSMFPDHHFDLVLNPVSNLYTPDVHPIWHETYRVLRPGGALLAAFMNPIFYIFDRQKIDQNRTLEVRHSIPYSDLASLEPGELEQIIEEEWPIEFGHSLEDQIGGQLRAGFVITGLYEDTDERNVLSKFTPVYIVTRAIKYSQEND